jgi:hypothetical protein
LLLIVLHWELPLHKERILQWLNQNPEPSQLRLPSLRGFLLSEAQLDLGDPQSLNVAQFLLPQLRSVKPSGKGRSKKLLLVYHLVTVTPLLPSGVTVRWNLI